MDTMASQNRDQAHNCLFNRLFRCRSKMTSKLRVTGFCETGEFPAQRTSNADRVSIWWRHHVAFEWPCDKPMYNTGLSTGEKWLSPGFFNRVIENDALVSGLSFTWSKTISLRWRHNGHDGVSNHQPHHCLLNRLFRSRSKKTSKLRLTGLCAGNSPVSGGFPGDRRIPRTNGQ